MKSMATIIYQLQTALKVKGFIVTINTTQFYSAEQDRFIKMYIIKRNKREIQSTASQIATIRCLKYILDIVSELEKSSVPQSEWDAAVQENLSGQSFTNK